MKVEMVRVDSLHESKDNPRKITPRAVEEVKRSIDEFGFRQPLVIRGQGEIVIGHVRHRAAKELGIEKVPAHRADDLTDKQISVLRIADNKTGEFSGWDVDALFNAFGDLKDEEIPGFSSEEREVFGVGMMGDILDPSPEANEPSMKASKYDENSSVVELRFTVPRGHASKIRQECQSIIEAYSKMSL